MEIASIGIGVMFAVFLLLVLFLASLWDEINDE